MLIPSKKRGEAVEILGSLAERWRFEAGCISCRVYQDVEEEQVIIFEELWEDEESLERHLRSDEYRKLLLVVEMATEYPEIRFNTISHSAGIETIERARNFTAGAERP
jgi:quinol monooxygenase YgiN